MLGASTALAGLVAFDAAAGPQDGQVVAGQAVIQQPGGGRTNILQSTDRAIIDWRGFSIGAGEHVDFQQPGAGSVTLNRVTGSQNSLIDGRLTATGSVFIVNPNGVIFGKGASVDVGGLVATTTNLSNANFMAGRFLFDQPSGVAGASVINEGSISIREGGLAALVAPSVRNSGVITARLGRVVLAGAETATVDLYGDGLFAFDTGVSTAVTHDGAINADGGAVLLTTAQAKGVVDSAISMGGTVTARSVEKQGGKIILKGAGSVAVAGTLDASGKGAGQTGGEVKVLGEQVALQATARVDVSGDQGGGKALIGGNVQGGGAEQRAANTLVSGGALISADALTAGRGGTVVVWSDNHTQYDGAISARGGAQSGDGGFVETSGKKTLGIQTGKVDASAAKGKGGQWLLDPRNVEIAAATANGALTSGTFTPTADNATVSATSIQTALNAGTNVTITTTDAAGTQAGNITTSADVTWTGSATLTLIAEGSITLSKNITGSTGTLDLRAAQSISQSAGTITVGTLLASAGSAGSITLDKANAIGTLGAFSAGGSFTLNDADGGLTISGVSTGTGGAVSITTAGALAIQGNLSGASISLTAGGDITQTGGTINTASLSVSTTGSATLDRANTIIALAAASTGGAFTLVDSADGLTISGSASATGALSISTAGGALNVQAGVSGAGITLSGSGLSIGAAQTVNGGSSAVVLDGGSGTLTLGAGTLVLGTGSITLRADSMDIAATAQVGGTAANTGSASSVTLTGSSAGRSIGIAGGSGDLALSAAELATVRAASGLIGSATSGAVTFDDWTPATTFASTGLTVNNNAGVSFAGAVTLAGNLVLNPGGAVTQGDALSVGGNTTVNAAGFNVTLDDADNSFQGRFGGSAAALTLKGGGLEFSTLSVASIAVTATGDITQSGNLTVSGTASFDAGSNAIALTQTGNNFSGAVTVTGGAVSITDTSAISIGGSAATLSVIAGGDITQGSDLSVSGTASFDAGSNAITLTRSGNDFTGAVSVTGGAVSVTDTNALSIGGTATGALVLDSGALTLTTLSAGSLAITSSGAVSQTGDLTVTGTTSVDAGNRAVTLDRTGNDFQGAVAVTGGAVSLTDNGAIVLGAIDAASLSVSAGDDVTQTGDIMVSGTTTLAAGSNAITLTRSGNDFDGAVSVTGGTVSITSSGALRIGGTTAGLTLSSGALTLDALSADSLSATVTGAVTQNAAISVTGATTIAAGGNTVTLDDSSNNFAGAVSITNAAAVSLKDTNAIALTTIGASSLTVTAGGNISQSTGAITVTNAASFTTTSGAITVAQSGNNFAGTVTASATSSISVRDGGDLTVGDISGTNVTLRSNGALTQANGTAITATGTASLIAGTGSITLENTGNDFTGAVGISASGAASLRDGTGGLVLGTVSVASLTLRAAGALTQSVSTAVTVTGISDITATSVTLANSGNNFTGAVTVTSAGDVSLRDSNAITLGDIAAAALSVQAGGAVAQSAGTAITAGGATSISTTSGDITLEATANSFGGALSLSGSSSAASIGATGDIAFGAVSVASLAVTATGNLTQSSGSIAVSTTTTLDAGAIALATATNDFTGAVTVSGTTVSLADATALLLGNVAADSLTISAGGALTQATSTNLQIAGASSLAGTSITLANTGNSFTGAVAASATAGAVSLAADAGLTLGAVSGTGLTATAGTTLRLTGAIATTGGAVALTGTDFVQDSGATLAAGTGSISVTADNMALSGTGSITTSNTVTLRTRDTGRNIRLGSAAGGSLSLSDGELNALSGASGLTIGRADGAGTITVAQALNLTGNAGNVTLLGGAVTLGQSITATGNIALTPAVTLSGAGSTLTAGGNVSLGNVAATTDGGQALVVAATGTVSLGTVGGANRLASLTVSGTTITLASGAATTGAQSYTGTVALAGNATFTTDDAAFTVTGNLRGTAAGRTLAIDAGTGALSITSVGSGTTIATFSATAGSIDIQGITATGNVTLTATTGGASLGTLSHGSGDVLVSADTIALTGSWTGTGARTVRPNSTGRSLTIGGAGFDFGLDFQLDTAELAFLGNAAPSTITIGRADGTGGVSIDAFNFDDTLTIQGGATTVQPGTIAWANAKTLTITANGNVDLLGGISGTSGSLVIAATGSVSQPRTFVTSPFFAFTPTAPITVETLSVDAGTGISLGGTFFGIGNAVSGRIDLVAGGAISYLGSGGVTLGTVSGGSFTLSGVTTIGQAAGTAITTTGATDLSAAGAVTLAALTAGSLSITGASSIGQTAGTVIAVSGTTALAATGAVTLTQAGNDFGGTVAVSSGGSVTLRDANALVLGNLTAASLDITLAGGLTQDTGTALSVSGTSRVTSSGGAVTLDRTGNDFGGTVTIAGAGTTTLADQNDLQLGAVTATSLAVTAQGALTQAASTALTIAGTTSVTAAGTTLTNADNDFQGAVSATSAGATGLTDKNALVLATVNAGSLSVTAAGALTQTGDITVAGTTAVAAGANAITLDRAGNDFQGTVSVTGGTVSITDGNALSLGTVNAASLAVTTAGALTQTGDITVTGTTTISTGTGAVALDRSNNDFQGSVSIASGAVTLADKNAIGFGTSAMASLDLTTGGAVSQSGDITVTGTSSIAAGSSTITLDRAGNDFGGAVSLATSAAVSLSDAGTLRLGGTTGALTTVSGALTFVALTATSLNVTAAGAVTQAAAITISGTTGIAAGTAAVTLSNGDNNFGGTVGVATSAAVSLGDVNALSLGTITAGSLGVTAGGNISQASGTSIATTGATSLTTTAGNITLRGITAGSLSATTADTGTITQAAGSLDIDGTTTLATGSGAITLNVAANDFTGAVAASTTGNVSIRDANALLLGNIAAAGLTLRSAGNITQAAGRTITAADADITASGGGNVTLANAGNDFTGTVTTSTTGSTSLRDDAGGLVLGTVSTGALTLNVGGALTQTAGTTLSATGAASLTAGTVTLANAGNNFGGTVSVSSSGDVTLRDSGALALGTVTAAALSLQTGGTLAFGTTVVTSLSVTAGGAVSQTGDIAVTSTTTLDADGQTITLNRAGNDFGDTVTAKGTTVAISDANALKLAGTTGALTIVSGALTLDAVSATALTVTAGGAVGQTAMITVTGATTIMAGGNAVTLNLIGNDFRGAVTVTGGTVAVSDNNELTFGGSAGAITLVGNLLTLNGISAGSLSVAGGQITQGSSGTITVTGDTVLTAGGLVMLTRSGNDFGGSVTLNGNGTVSISDANALRLAGAAGVLTVSSGTLSLDGLVANGLTVTTTGPVTQTAALSVAGDTTIAAGSAAVTLDDAGNNFGGPVAVTTSGAVSLRDSNVIRLGPLSAGSLSVVAGSDVIQTGALTVAGQVTVDAAGSDVTLANAGNAVGGFTVNGNNVELRDAGATVLGASVLGGNLSLITTGAVTQTGALFVAGTTSITTAKSGAGSISLNQAGNSFTGAVSLTGGPTALRTSGPLVIAAADTLGTLTLTGSGISQTGAIAATGLMTLDAGSGTVALGNAANGFNRLAILSAASAGIVTTQALDVGTVAVTGDLTVKAGGSITQTAAMLVGGTASFSAIAGSDITLTRSGNDFATFTATNARNVSVTDQNSLVLGPVSITGTLTVNAGGTITQTDALFAGRLEGESGGATTLEISGNVIATLGDFTAGGELKVTSGAATFIIAERVAGDGVSLVASAVGATLVVQNGGSIVAGGANVLLQADDIELGAAIGGSGIVTLQSTTLSRNITVGTAVAGELSLTQAELDRLTDGHSAIVIGHKDGFGRIDIRSTGAVTFRDPVTFRSPKAGGSVGLNASLVGLGNASFTFEGSGATTTLNGSITTAGQDIVFDDAVLLGSNLALSNQPGRTPLPTAVIDTTGGGSNPAGANVVFNKGVDSTNAFLEGMDIFAGTAGNVVFKEDIGGNTEVGRLRVFSGGSFSADVDKIMTRILDIEVTGLALARNVVATEELLIRGTSGTADLTLSEVRGREGAFAAFFVRRPDGVSDTYRINGCIMATTCGMDMVFMGVSLPPYRDDPDIGVRGVEGSLGSPAMRSPRLVSASVGSNNDDFSIQYSSPADRELW